MLDGMQIELSKKYIHIDTPIMDVQVLAYYSDLQYCIVKCMDTLTS